MRYLFHFGLFAMGLTLVTPAGAQERRHRDRHTTVVSGLEAGSRVVRPVRASFEPPRAVYDSRRAIHTSSTAKHDARRAYFDERQDLEQITRIAERWEQATANRDRHAQSRVDRRLDAWLEREIRESIREPRNQRYTHRVRALSDELAMLERRKHDGHHYGNRGHHYGNRGYQGRGHRGFAAKKSRILYELVQLSEQQARRAGVNARHPFRLSFAYR